MTIVWLVGAIFLIIPLGLTVLGIVIDFIMGIFAWLEDGQR